MKRRGTVIPMTHKPCCDGAMQALYLLSCATAEAGGGIYRCRLSVDGMLTKTDYMPCDRPMYAVRGGERLHVLLRAPFVEREESGYFFCKTDFSDVSKLVGTNGKCACHLAVSGEDVYVVNYLNGSLTKIGGITVTHTEKGVNGNPTRQEAPHTHYVRLSADNRFIFCTDLGADTLFVYDYRLNEVSHAKVPNGYGIRHLVLTRNGRTIYAVNELVPSVSRFSFADGVVTYLDTVSLPCEVLTSTAAAIRLSEDEKRLYVSVRGENRIFALNTEDRVPKLIHSFPCGGCGPRDFDLIGGFLIVCNEGSDEVSVLETETGEKRFSLSMKHPFCCVCC